MKNGNNNIKNILILKYAHIKNGVIYNIDTTQYDDKADSDVLIDKSNCPQLVFTFIKGENTQKGGNYLPPFFVLIFLINVNFAS